MLLLKMRQHFLLKKPDFCGLKELKTKMKNLKGEINFLLFIFHFSL